MKSLKVVTLILTLMGFIGVVNIAMAASPNSGCTTLQDGVINYSATHYMAGQPIGLGFDPYGYNYQAHLFEGSYANVYLGGYGYPPYEDDDESYLEANPTVVDVWCWLYRNVALGMKWNDAWTSNKDCNGDGKLDRPAPYKGSGAWETNHMVEKYKGEDGKTYQYEYFAKIVAVPSDAVKTGGVWYTADGEEIGYDIWGEFAVIQEVYNDPGYGYNGILSKSPFAPGFGRYKE